jgi:hypothetical protein
MLYSVGRLVDLSQLYLIVRSQFSSLFSEAISMKYFYQLVCIMLDISLRYTCIISYVWNSDQQHFADATISLTTIPQQKYILGLF